VRRVAVLGLGLLVLSGCAAATRPGNGTVVAAVAPAGAAEGGEGREVVQGTVTKVEPEANLVHLDVRLVWAPVLRAEHRAVEATVGPLTRFVPEAFRTRLQPGDEVQVSLAPGEDDHPYAAEITVLDLE
jgi:hypothetical protein